MRYPEFFFGTRIGAFLSVCKEHWLSTALNQKSCRRSKLLLDDLPCRCLFDSVQADLVAKSGLYIQTPFIPRDKSHQIDPTL